jgi:hypothetical protein
MTSQRKIEANRRNAKRSTGPKTVLGKKRSRANALKHGLAAAMLRPVEKPDDRELYEALLGSGHSTSAQREQALAIVEATSELEYVRSIRTKIVQSLDDIHFMCCDLVDAVLSTERYERRALARRRKASKILLKETSVDASVAKRSQT